MDQTSLFPEVLYWIPEVDTSTRMWKCPGCGGRVVGHPMNWDPWFNPYHFCPYCGIKLETTKGKTNEDY